MQAHFRKRPKKHLGVILAAGQSTRWNASIREPESEFYWENVRRVQQNLLDRGMASLRDDIIRGPTPNEITSIGEHKALIKVDGDELIYRTIRLFGERQIDTVYPVLGKKSEPIKDYLHSIRELKLERLWAHMPKWRETLPTVDSGGTTYSAVIGLVEAHKAMHDDDYVIMAYSDIIWELRLLDSLMSTQGDIVVLADGRWAMMGLILI